MDADYGADEEGYEQDDADGIDAELAHFFEVLFEEHAHALGACKGAAHECEIAAEGAQAFENDHLSFFKDWHKINEILTDWFCSL